MTDSTQDLARACQESLNRPDELSPETPIPCYQLLNRAFEDEDQEALEYVHEIYQPQVEHWVRQHNAFGNTGQSVEYFVDRAWQKLYQSIAGQQFQQFKTVANILTYLKQCVHSEIVRYLRKLPTLKLRNVSKPRVSHDDIFSSSAESANIWDHIRKQPADDNAPQRAKKTFSNDFEARDLSDKTWRNNQPISRGRWHNTLANPQVRRAWYKKMK